MSGEREGMRERERGSDGERKRGDFFIVKLFFF